MDLILKFCWPSRIWLPVRCLDEPLLWSSTLSRMAATTSCSLCKAGKQSRHVTHLTWWSWAAVISLSKQWSAVSRMLTRSSSCCVTQWCFSLIKWTHDAQRGIKRTKLCKFCSFTIIPLGKTPNQLLCFCDSNNHTGVYREAASGTMTSHCGGHHKGRYLVRRNCQEQALCHMVTIAAI